MDDDRNAPASKADLAELETRITARFKADLAESETRIVETLTKVIRDSQAEIVKAFSVCVETVQTQLKARDDTYAGFAERLTVLEERVLEVEKKLIMPPAA